VTLFDAYVVADWSANSTPKTGKDSIWVADAWLDPSGRLRESPPRNHATRAQAEQALTHHLLEHGARGRRVFLGVDFALGYPADSLSRLTPGTEAPWRTAWRLLASRITDDERNRNNRWQVAAELNQRLGALHFWGTPPSAATPTLTSKKPKPHLAPNFRLTEESLRQGGLRPFSVWQLLGNGSVGSQALLGIPVCERLRAMDALGLRVWPFETRTPDAPNLIAEIWPGTIKTDVAAHAVRDAAQVLSLVRWLAAQDAAGTLAPFLELRGLSAAHRRRVVETEGWVLGHLPPG
jgi:hypothetical protein